jgi:hypothetical protein
MYIRKVDKVQPASEAKSVEYGSGPRSFHQYFRFIHYKFSVAPRNFAQVFFEFHSSCDVFSKRFAIDFKLKLQNVAGILDRIHFRKRTKRNDLIPFLYIQSLSQPFSY